MPVTLYLWWILSNGILSYASLDFLLCVAETDGRKHIPLFLAINAVLTAGITDLQIPGTFWLEIPWLMVYAVLFMQIQWAKLLTPIAILFTLRTFLEGFTAVLTAYTASHLNLSSDGTLVQIFLSLLLTIIFLLLLRFVQTRFVRSLQKSVSSYLYALLLPCALMVLTIRYGLRLDGSAVQPHLFSFHAGDSFTTVFLMIGAAIVFFIMLEIFSRVIRWTEQETAVTLLTSQLAGQQIYMDEAKKRNELYASFQHDLKNHLLVLSGLIHQGNYEAAGQYADKLHASCHALRFPVSTGNMVLDTLLSEKLSYAHRCKIHVVCQVRIPPGFPVDDMDLCVIVSNILDNAITACTQVEPSKRVLHISTNVRGNFLVLESTNSVAVSRPIQAGIGLQNIKSISKKYQGITELEDTDGTFRIRVLLCAQKKVGCT